MNQALIFLGVVILGLGVLWPLFHRMGLGRLPGDINVQRPGFRFFAPLGSSLLLSVILSLVLSLGLSMCQR